MEPARNGLAEPSAVSEVRMASDVDKPVLPGTSNDAKYMDYENIKPFNKRKNEDNDLYDLANNVKKVFPNSSQNITSSIHSYGEHSKGPFEVWVRYAQQDSSPYPNFNIYSVGKIVNKRYKSIIEVRKDGRSNGVIIFKDRKEANAAFNDKTFTDNKMITFIPNFRKERKGVLRGIPIDLKEEELLEAIVSPIPVTQVKRLNTKNRNPTSEEDKWIPSTSILVNFSGEVLPKEISIYFVMSKVHPYIRQPTQCFKCFRYGHVAKFCRNKERCSMCGESHGEKVTTCEGIVPRCANCKMSHKSVSRECTIYMKNKLVLEKVAIDNISISEARKLVFGRSNAPLRSMVEFPSLQSQREKEAANANFNSYSNAVRDSSRNLDFTNLNKLVYEEELFSSSPLVAENCDYASDNDRLSNSFKKNFNANVQKITLPHKEGSLSIQPGKGTSPLPLTAPSQLKEVTNRLSDRLMSKDNKIDSRNKFKSIVPVKKTNKHK